MQHLQNKATRFKTRMHSSRMCTARLLTVSGGRCLHPDLCPTSAQPQGSGLHLGGLQPGWSAQPQGVCIQGGSASRGVCIQRGLGRPSPSPHVDRITHRCKTLPCPKLHLRVVMFCVHFTRVSREKQNSNCMREKSLFCEAVDNLAQRC